MDDDDDEVLVEIVMATPNNNNKEDISSMLPARTLHTRSYSVCGKDKLARRQSRSFVKLQQQQGDVTRTIVPDQESEK